MFSTRKHLHQWLTTLVRVKRMNLLNNQQQNKVLMPGHKRNQWKPKSRRNYPNNSSHKKIRLLLIRNLPKNRSLLMHLVERAWQKLKRKRMTKTLMKMRLRKTALLKRIPKKIRTQKRINQKRKKRKSPQRKWNRAKSHRINHLPKNPLRVASFRRRNRKKKMRIKKSLRKSKLKRMKSIRNNRKRRRKSRENFRLLIRLKQLINRIKNWRKRSMKKKLSSKNVSKMSLNGRKSNKLNSRES